MAQCCTKNWQRDDNKYDRIKHDGRSDALAWLAFETSKVDSILNQLLIQPFGKATTIPIAPKTFTSDPAHLTINL